LPATAGEDFTQDALVACVQEITGGEALITTPPIDGVERLPRASAACIVYG